jgi:hypothetical protein
VFTFLYESKFSIRQEAYIIIIIISVSMPQCWDTVLPYGLHIRRTGHPQRWPSAGWCVLTTANAAGTNGLTCFPKHGGGRDNKFLVTHPMTDQRCLTSAIARRSVLISEPSSSSRSLHLIFKFILM